MTSIVLHSAQSAFALIAAVIILAVVFLGRTTSSTFSKTGNCVSTSGTGAGC